MSYHCVMCKKMYHQDDGEWTSSEEFNERHPGELCSSGMFSRKCISLYYGLYMDIFTMEEREEMCRDDIETLEKRIQDGEFKVECR